jgi:hypothetical protein
MSTVSHPASRFNPCTPSFYTTDGGTIASYNPRNGHCDDPQCAALADNRVEGPPANGNEVLPEIEADRAIQAADEAHTAELRAAYTRAKELAGPATVKIGRQLQLDTDSRTPAAIRSWWYAIIDTGAVGMAATPAAAVDEALEQLDKRHHIASPAPATSSPAWRWWKASPTAPAMKRWRCAAG